MQTRRSLILVLLLAAMTLPALCRADSEPMVLKASLRINTSKFLRYFTTPTAKEPVYNTTAWVPRLSFTIAGPLAGGSQLSITFNKPDGTPWLNMPLTTPEIPENEYAGINNQSISNEYLEKRATIVTGLFSYSIHLKNALAGTEKTLMSGKFKVGKFHYGNALPEYKNQNEYFIDHDWTLPIGTMGFDDRPDVEAPQLHAAMWFRGVLDTTTLTGYVFYKGKQICSTKTQGSLGIKDDMCTPGAQADPRWQRWLFNFSSIASTNKMTSAGQYPDTHFLDKNPGVYEIKILRDGKLARTATFTVGEDGKVVDNGLNAKNKIGGTYFMLPVKVIPGTDGKAVLTTYTTDSFYGNPITGFPAP